MSDKPPSDEDLVYFVEYLKGYHDLSPEQREWIIGTVCGGPDVKVVGAVVDEEEDTLDGHAESLRDWVHAAFNDGRRLLLKLLKWG